MEEGNTREVRFDIFCSKCKHKDVKETELPCDECLEEGFNYDSKKPVKFEPQDIHEDKVKEVK